VGVNTKPKHRVVSRWEGRNARNQPEAYISCACGWSEKGYYADVVGRRYMNHLKREGVRL
jgi:hypothetical protein